MERTNERKTEFTIWQHRQFVSLHILDNYLNEAGNNEVKVRKFYFALLLSFRSLHPLLKPHYNDLKRLNLMVRCTNFNTSTQNSKTSQIVTINKKEIKVEETVRFK